ncbi:hypothetical protein ASPBRDRAFT_36654 [Aspergillus brasiliensis CBS 101740]|uniref:NAD(P)-binding domain-containing protein n=1 Tax=Aspergillus brasiliensis (strain CBS 101740 / IMI 381727 / IBT 21946) TaxID=767769 RepID=A0A1L9V0X0_ASPBC|nr:hypothetical protein ASPBRDRAFT_36654 [Aspergillus brasiliensis CBS 101740]
MSSCYAVLGATGNCGSSLIQILLQNPNASIHAYCRNKAKLEKKLPDEVKDPRLQIFAGSISDEEVLGDCIRGCKAIFLVVTMNDNLPGCRVAEDTARGVVSVLKKSSPQPMPKLVVLSSATIDPYLSRNMPWWFHPIMIRAGSYVYDDLRVQEKFLRAQEDWLTTIYIKPGGLAVDKPRGYRLDFDRETSFIAYIDLAAAMVEAVEDVDGRYDFKNVSVVNTGRSAAFPLGTPLCILYGLLSHYFPWLHPYLPKSGP